MPGSVNEIAELLKADIGATSWSVPVVAERTHLPLYERKGLSTTSVLVTVVGRTVAIETESRTSSSRVVDVDVGLRVKVDSDSNEALDKWVDFAEEVAEAYLRKRLGDWVCMETGVGSLATEAILEDRLVVIVLSTTWRRSKK